MQTPARISLREKEIALVAASLAFSDVYAELNGLAASRSCGRRMRLRKDEPLADQWQTFLEISLENFPLPRRCHLFFLPFSPHVPWKCTAEITPRDNTACIVYSMRTREVLTSDALLDETLHERFANWRNGTSGYAFEFAATLLVTLNLVSLANFDRTVKIL